MNSTLSPIRQKFIWGFLFLLLVVIASSAVFHKFANEIQTATSTSTNALLRQERMPEGSVLAVFGQAPYFSLTERSGRTLTKNDLIGKPWVADFIFTSCAGQCPLMSLEMQRLQRLFPERAGLQFVSFTVDPERDTPEVLSKYADRYGAEKERWFFLTGMKGEINRILNQFFLSPVEEPAMHSIRFILVDGRGQIRGYYDSSDAESMKQLVHDANILMK